MSDTLRCLVPLALPIVAVAFLATGSTPTRASVAVQGAFVRVNQVGYPIGTPKRAYLLSQSAATGAVFTVRSRGGSTVLRGRVGPSTGRWSRRFPFVYALDFGAVRQAGTYTISVQGRPSATSPPFQIAPASNLYAKALRNGLAFFQAERDGRDYVRSALRTAPAHLHDRNAMTYATPAVNADGNFKGDLRPLGRRIDASGGWWDAGDYLKFVQTTSYTVDVLLAGARRFPNLLGRGSRTSNLQREGRFGLDWLERMWDDPNRTLYYQVGIGSGNDAIVGDHDIWRLPQRDDAYGGSAARFRYIRHRPVFRAGPPGSRISPNLAGRDAAAFALCYQLWHRADPAYASRCLLDAEHVFDLANTHPKKLLTVIPFDFYGETEWRDDLELGAAELALALREGTPPSGLPHADGSYYLRAAARWARAYIHGPNDAADTLNLYDVSGLAHYELAQAIRRYGTPGGLAVTRAGLVRDLRKQVRRGLAQAGRDPFQFGYPWATWDTTAHGAGLSVTASEYDELTGARTYAAWSSRWLGNILGANPWGTSLVVGDGATFPHCMQHQVANLVGSRDGSRPILAGAAVEGPNSYAATGTVEHMRRCPPQGGDAFKPFDAKAVYQDNVQAYSTVEPAIDLTAATPLAFARQAAGLF